MTDYVVPNEDVNRGAEVLYDTFGIGMVKGEAYTRRRVGMQARVVLASVLPAHDRALILALADEWWSPSHGRIGDVDVRVIEWLRRKAEQIGGDDV